MLKQCPLLSKQYYCMPLRPGCYGACLLFKTCPGIIISLQDIEGEACPLRLLSSLTSDHLEIYHDDCISALGQFHRRKDAWCAVSPSGRAQQEPGQTPGQQDLHSPPGSQCIVRLTVRLVPPRSVLYVERSTAGRRKRPRESSSGGSDEPPARRLREGAAVLPVQSFSPQPSTSASQLSTSSGYSDSDLSDSDSSSLPLFLSDFSDSDSSSPPLFLSDSSDSDSSSQPSSSVSQPSSSVSQPSIPNRFSMFSFLYGLSGRHAADFSPSVLMSVAEMFLERVVDSPYSREM
ncbi:uncharacterized protein LOC119034046 [Acanthopagrus latus]|uniref:uncharacterized protein LOC119034046 n=1 Tax=Acanthopagrus latus TaxID=8177 RepID=UPI00187C1D94|nr:uncharacterized protein LOC119034046 [Acanthopagrus latus]